jgi:hypothetical protein
LRLTFSQKTDRIQSINQRDRVCKLELYIKKDAIYRVSTFHWDLKSYLAAAASRSLVSLITVSATLAGQEA